MFLVVLLTSLALLGCGPKLPLAPAVVIDEGETPFYIIGPGDTVEIFVWGNPEVSTGAPVRPDGRITVPLVEDLQATGKTPTELARDLEQALARYIRTPVVTVMVGGFVGRSSEQIRIVGEATEPQALPYREKMTLLDVMIAVGGITEFAEGNDSVIVRTINGAMSQYRVRIEDLIKDGDITANVQMLPGDVLIIPEAWF
ncbi:XrtA/PEP-CTERM system exopolysaccharide export protein [Nitrosococcus wardiae]|uniref:Sugar ABC transporter substrate-binding protein n=1 Tax=Nitrosococcus wardiae TaxID=1814290 RepID=A0A4P7BZ52_9GAMM|nr:XrtA/PEP-CTERM system exopolysaccharide export protein [Nitrosococcus wardiae]QBQ54474.1 sugar ABC transporter substrate-binding protein [Nitrosococcus wardiae]